MWNTPAGNRVLIGNERRLIVRGVVELWTLLTDLEGEWWVSGSPFFDDIPLEDRSYALLKVATHLLSSEEPPEHHAWSEGAMLAVFNLIGQRVEEEVEKDRRLGPSKSRIFWRQLVHDAWMERCYEPPSEIDWEPDEGPRQRLRSRNLDFWDFKVVLLTDEILFDRDCVLDDFMRMPSGIAATIMRQMGIENDYYTAMPAALKEADRERLLRFLKNVRGSVSSGTRRRRRPVSYRDTPSGYPAREGTRGAHGHVY